MSTKTPQEKKSFADRLTPPVFAVIVTMGLIVAVFLLVKEEQRKNKYRVSLVDVINAKLNEQKKDLRKTHEKKRQHLKDQIDKLKKKVKKQHATIIIEKARYNVSQIYNGKAYFKNPIAKNIFDETMFIYNICNLEHNEKTYRVDLYTKYQRDGIKRLKKTNKEYKNEIQYCGATKTEKEKIRILIEITKIARRCNRPYMSRKQIKKLKQYSVKELTELLRYYTHTWKQKKECPHKTVTNCLKLKSSITATSSETTLTLSGLQGLSVDIHPYCFQAKLIAIDVHAFFKANQKATHVLCTAFSKKQKDRGHMIDSNVLRIHACKLRVYSHLGTTVSVGMKGNLNGSFNGYTITIKK